MGNPLRRDDGIGPRVVEELKKEALPKDVELSVRESDIFELLDELQNRSRVLVVDAVDMGSPPGTVRVFTPREASLQLNADPVSTHGFGLRELVKFAEALSVPADFVIVGIQAGDVSMGENMSPQVETAVNEAVRSIRHLLS
jgi:hydrogenase maturation protease